jgi:tRNA A37 threonylcarbamoyladenosine modification protein TsaB
VEVSENRELWSVIDAQRSQLFAAKFEGRAGCWHALVPAAVVDIDAWLASLAPDTLVTGGGLKRLGARLPAGVAVAESLWQPRAASVGRLAWHDYQAGRRDDLWTLAPQYLRPSAAEEKASHE